MQNSFELNEWPEIWGLQISKIEIQKGGPNNLAVLQNFPLRNQVPLFNLRKFQKPQKSTTVSCRTQRNLMNEEEFRPSKLLKLKYKREDQINQLFCRIGSPQEIRSPLFNLRKFEKPDKSTTASCRMHSNLENHKEFGSLKLLKLKHKRGD